MKTSNSQAGIIRLRYFSRACQTTKKITNLTEMVKRLIKGHLWREVLQMVMIIKAIRTMTMKMRKKKKRFLMQKTLRLVLIIGKAEEI
jgi:hypothetical protein